MYKFLKKEPQAHKKYTNSNISVLVKLEKNLIFLRNHKCKFKKKKMVRSRKPEKIQNSIDLIHLLGTAVSWSKTEL